MLRAERGDTLGGKEGPWGRQHALRSSLAAQRPISGRTAYVISGSWTQPNHRRLALS
jgi:hypothetical protein